MINVLVVDDSAFMRKALSIMLEKDDDIVVTGSARNGEEALAKIRELQPDVVTMDIEMPQMNGLEALEIIMRDMPTPVLVVSSVTTKGAAVTLEALEKGAMDYIPKTQSYVAIDITKIEEELIRKVKAVGRKKTMTHWRSVERAKHKTPDSAKPDVEHPTDLSGHKFKCLGIGVSTGGPPVIQAILSSLAADFPVPVLIAQHMPKAFTRTFAERLDKVCSIRVKEGETGDQLEPGTAYVGRGGDHLTLKRNGVGVFIELTDEPTDLLYHPSADVLFSFISSIYGAAGLGLILTGMGKDGLLGLKELKKRGGWILSQNEKTSAVYGMPKAVNDAGLSDGIHSIEGIISSLKTMQTQPIMTPEGGVTHDG